MNEDISAIKRSGTRVAAFCLLLFLVISGCGSQETRFRPDMWEQGKPDNDVRCGIVDDLLKNHLRVGMTRQEVEQLIGKPFADIEKGRNYKTKGRILVYGIGRCPGQIDIEELRIVLGPDGRVESFGRVQG